MKRRTRGVQAVWSITVWRPNARRKNWTICNRRREEKRMGCFRF